jgi:hypothetical protein
MVTHLVESLRWTIVVPLPAIMELDGLTLNPTPLGNAAEAAIAFVVGHVRSHTDGLKAQTSCGDYLSSLTIHNELVDFDNPGSWDRLRRELKAIMTRKGRWNRLHSGARYYWYK